MQPWKVFTLFTATALLVVCAQSSGVLKLGPDTYSVSFHAAPLFVYGSECFLCSFQFSMYLTASALSLITLAATGYL